MWRVTRSGRSIGMPRGRTTFLAFRGRRGANETRTLNDRPALSRYGRRTCGRSEFRRVAVFVRFRCSRSPPSLSDRIASEFGGNGVVIRYPRARGVTAITRARPPAPVTSRRISRDRGSVRRYGTRKTADFKFGPTGAGPVEHGQQDRERTGKNTEPLPRESRARYNRSGRNGSNVNTRGRLELRISSLAHCDTKRRPSGTRNVSFRDQRVGGRHYLVHRFEGSTIVVNAKAVVTQLRVENRALTSNAEQNRALYIECRTKPRTPFDDESKPRGFH